MARSVGTMVKRETTSEEKKGSLSRVCDTMNFAKWLSYGCYTYSTRGPYDVVFTTPVA